MAGVYFLLLGSITIIATVQEAAATNHNEKGEDLYASRKNVYVPSEIYTTSWAVEITEGGQLMADSIADKYGFKNLGRVPVHF